MISRGHLWLDRRFRVTEDGRIEKIEFFFNPTGIPPGLGVGHGWTGRILPVPRGSGLSGATCILPPGPLLPYIWIPLGSQVSELRVALCPRPAVAISHSPLGMTNATCCGRKGPSRPVGGRDFDNSDLAFFLDLWHSSVRSPFLILSGSLFSGFCIGF
jgi:hypothetical protein